MRPKETSNFVQVLCRELQRYGKKIPVVMFLLNIAEASLHCKGKVESSDIILLKGSSSMAILCHWQQ
jgi:hypothetical protein